MTHLPNNRCVGALSGEAPQDARRRREGGKDRSRFVPFSWSGVRSPCTCCFRNLMPSTRSWILECIRSLTHECLSFVFQQLRLAGHGPIRQRNHAEVLQAKQVEQLRAPAELVWLHETGLGTGHGSVLPRALPQRPSHPLPVHAPGWSAPRPAGPAQVPPQERRRYSRT